jgi:peptidyl-prolyl cis-trans isomerase SurA
LFAQVAAALSASVLLAAMAGCNQQTSGDVMATVDGRKIFRAEVDKYYDNNVASAQQAPSGEQATALRLNILHQMIDDEILMRRAEKLGLLATDEEVDRKYNEFKSPFSQQEFDQRLKDKKITLADFKHDMRRSITVEKVMNKEVSSKINVTDQDITDYYNAHKGEFNLIEPQYHLAGIQVSAQGAQQVNNLQNNKASGEDDARKKIQALKNRIDAGEDFGMLASQFSENPNTAPNGGDMGFVYETQLKQATDPATDAAIMKLKPGQTTDILPIADPQTHKLAGYVIYKLISKEPAGQRDLNDPRVQQSIRQQLHDGRSQLLKNAYVEILHDEAKIRNFYAEEVFKETAK